MISTRAKVQNFYENDIDFSFQKNVKVVPKDGSLRSTLQGMVRPSAASWSHDDEREFGGEFGWTHDSQDLVIEGNNIYASTGPESGNRLFKLDKNFSIVSEGSIAVSGDHLGGIDLFNGKIYGAVEPYGEIAIFDKNANFINGQKLGGTDFNDQDGSSELPWIAFDPITQYMYSSHYVANDLYVYDPTSLRSVGSVSMSRSISEINSGSFSDSGLLFLASHGKSGVFIVSPLSGKVFGKIDIKVDKSFNVQEKLEGVFNLGSTGESDEILYVSVLDRDFPDDNDVILKTFRKS